MPLFSSHFRFFFPLGLALLASGIPVAAQLSPPPAQAALLSAGSTVAAANSASADPVAAGRGTILGTVADLNGDVIPGAKVTLTEVKSGTRRDTLSGDTGAFLFSDLKGNTAYRLTVQAPNFIPWQSADLQLAAGQSLIVPNIDLKLAGETQSIVVHGDTVEIATEQVQLETHQRVLGIVPNFYVVYDSANAVPLTTKLKFKLALKVSTDPVTVIGIGFLSAVNQAADTPGFQQGWLGYGQRFGATAADGFSGIMVGGAVLPSLLHQDPRYFYQGTGSTSSRFRHAVFAPFVCRGDNGKSQPNYSSLGGDLFSSALSNAYYPQSDRGASLFLSNFTISTAERILSTLAQEFILSRFTSKGSR